MAIKKVLKKKAKENTSITQKVHNEKNNLVQQNVKEGKPNEHIDKHNVNKYGPRTVGMALGLTKNMDNYESLRVDCWLTDTVNKGESHKDALDRVGEILEEVLTEETEKLI